MADLINGIDVSTFTAQISKKYIQPASITNVTEWLENSLIPIRLRTQYTFKKIEIKILFNNNNRDLIKTDISNFMTIGLEECDIKFRNLSNIFHCFLTDAATEDTDFDNWLYLNLTFLGYEYSNEITETMTSVTNKSITVQGNTETPAIVEITPTIDLIDLVLYGFGEDSITINNLTANKKVIIDGETGLVTVDGVNKYDDTDMWDFPTLQPGTNTITCSRSTANITIKYKPRWI